MQPHYETRFLIELQLEGAGVVVSSSQSFAKVTHFTCPFKSLLQLRSVAWKNFLLRTQSSLDALAQHFDAMGMPDNLIAEIQAMGSAPNYKLTDA